MARLTLAVLAALVLSWPIGAAAQGFKVPPTPDHRVTDNAGALSSDTRAAVENELHAYESATGHQIVVWIGQTTGDVPLETWTGEAAHQWKIGRRGHDDGAVLFLFMRDHKVRIEVGYGLEGSLTDADSHRIIADDIVPRMKANDPDGAVSSGVAAILTTITPSYKGVTPPPTSATSGETSDAGTMVIVLVGIFFIVLIFVIIIQIVRALRYGYLVLREGPTAARKDMRNWPAYGAVVLGGGGFSSGGDSGGGGFSAGGGDFGGGGASGSW